MNIFAVKDIKKLFMAVIIILVCAIVTGQLMVSLITNNYKEDMITHDYAVMGYLYSHNLAKSEMVKAFTAEKAAADFSTGQELLQAVGYKSDINNSLIPPVQSFQQKYALLAFVIFLIFAIMMIAVLLIFLVHQDRKLSAANESLQKFMSGDYKIRLKDSEEGSLSKLFASVNDMATSLTAHINKEKQNKEFLKDTISDISHQLKTPLAALQMYNEIIEAENIENNVVTSFISKSKNELNRMENLIKNLLKLARLDAGAIEIEKSKHNLKAFFEKNLKGFFTRAEMENKTIILKCDESIVLDFDEEWLWEALSNLIKNALDHTDSQDEIAVVCAETPIGITITVQDNGFGINPEDIHHIFKRFYRSRFSKDKQGIGIGLTLSKSILEKHGASIIVESELGKGSRFYITFPKLTDL